MPRYRNTVGGSVVNIDDGLATRLGIADSPAWEPLDEHGAPAPAEALSDRLASQTFTPIVPENAEAAPVEPTPPTEAKAGRKPSNQSQGAQDASGSD